MKQASVAKEQVGLEVREVNCLRERQDKVRYQIKGGFPSYIMRSGPRISAKTRLHSVAELRTITLAEHSTQTERCELPDDISVPRNKP